MLPNLLNNVVSNVAKQRYQEMLTIATHNEIMQEAKERRALCQKADDIIGVLHWQTIINELEAEAHKNSFII